MNLSHQQVSFTEDQCMMSKPLLIFFTAVLCSLVSCSNRPEGNSTVPDSSILSISCSTITPDSVLIGYAADACFGPSGEILVLDQAAARVLVFDHDGYFVEYMGRSGDGPGEMGNPMSVETVADRIIVRDQTKHGYIVFNSDHLFVEQISLWPTGSPTDMQSSGHSIFTAFRYEIVQYGDGLGAFREIAAYTFPECQKESVFYNDTVPLDPTEVTSLISASENLLFAAASSGMVFTGISSGSVYSVTALSRTGEKLYAIEEEYQPVPKTDDEIAAEKDFMNSQMQSMGVQGSTGWVPDENREMIRSLGCDQEGNLWVESALEEFPAFNVYLGSTGEFIRRVVFPVHGFRWNFRIEPEGILCWDEDPEDGIFRVHVLEIL